ncbi:MAG: hypothetical protein KAR37_09705, partial [Alphaproteobacteria bacterium]|nr:hypothetical protein [Alphaproteobacteria bacterium]
VKPSGDGGHGFFFACPGAVPVAAGVVCLMIWPGGTWSMPWQPVSAAEAAASSVQRSMLRRVLILSIYKTLPSGHGLQKQVNTGNILPEP